MVGWGLSCCLAIPTVAQQEADSTGATDAKKIRFTTYPVVGYQPETSFLFGSISFILFDLSDSAKTGFYRPSSITPVFIYTLREQLIISPRVALNFTDDYRVRGEFNYRYYPNNFFGIGNHTKGEDLEQFTENKWTVEGRILRVVARKMLFGLGLYAEENRLSDFEPDGLLEALPVEGKQGGFNLGLGPSMQYDTRDDIIFSTKGHYFQLDFLMYPNAFGNDFRYQSLDMDYRKFYSPGGRHTFAGRVMLSGRFGNEVPFYQYAQIGGSRRLRGIQSTRYIDRKSYLVQLEHRMLVYDRIGTNFAVGIGDVEPEIRNFSVDNVKYNFSGGLRIRVLKKDRLNLGIDYGIAIDGQRDFYLSVGEAF